MSATASARPTLRGIIILTAAGALAWVGLVYATGETHKAPRERAGPPGQHAAPSCKDGRKIGGERTEAR